MKTVKFEIEDNAYRTTEKDYTYYSSDLSKFIGEELSKIMTSINGDLLQFKKSKDMLRVGEYKHEGESMGYQQLNLLNKIEDVFEYARKGGCPTKLEVVILIGNPPFNRLIIQDLTRGICFQIEGQEEVRNYLTIEEDVKDSKPVKKIYF